MFSFLLTEESVAAGFEKSAAFGRYSFFFDENTPLQTAKNGENELLLYGYAVDVTSGEFQQLAETVLKKSSDIDALLKTERTLGGKYVLLYKAGDAYYVIPDASASVPVFVCEAGTAVCSSHSTLFGQTTNPELMKIRHSGDISQAMPYDVTEYRGIKQLLPNHYFAVNARCAVRFVNESDPSVPLSAAEAAAVTAPLIQTLTQYYLSQFDCQCPITGGRDSRVVLASLISCTDKTVGCYTMRHDGMTEESSDIAIPLKLAENDRVSHRVIEDVAPSAELTTMADEWFGKGLYSKRTLMLANTVKAHCGKAAVINGDIIGQVGKCSLHRDIPQMLATAGYFRCKLHNYSREAKALLKTWLADIRNAQEKVNTFDLFSMESRMGRWAAQENLQYNTLEQAYLNIFNSRSIVYVWTAVPRKQRKRSAVHIELIRLLYEDLLAVPFEGESSFLAKLAKSNGLFYYLFSYLKFWMQKAGFKR